jgi:serine/threonine protein kinase
MVMDHEKRHGTAGLTAGDVVDYRFEIVGELGRGAAGTVYRAHDRDLDEPVALKLLQVHYVDPVWTAERFRSEVKLARRVAHANVCRIFDYGEHAGRPYFSMELIEGSTVKQRLAAGTYRPAAALEVAAQVADALEAIHRAGVVHRDLKPQNLIETRDGVVKVTDFGVATCGRGDAREVERYVLGTPEYMSPEQVHGQPLDARSDLYSLGVVLLEMLTGRVPLEGVDPLRELTGIPPTVVAVLRVALARRPEDRYADAAAMARALREARSGLSATRDGTTLTHPVPAVTPRPLVASRLLLALSLAVAALAAAQSWDPAAATPPRTADAAVSGAPGWLQIGIRPWAHVFVDGIAVGTTPLRRLALRPGVHTVHIDNPYYRPLTRKVYIRPGETTPLRVDLQPDDVRR